MIFLIEKTTEDVNIIDDILKELDDETTKTIHKICKTGILLKDWMTSIKIPLHKKDSTLKSVLLHPSKVMLHIVNNRLRYSVEEQISREQVEFVRRRGTRNQVVGELIEKCRECNASIVMCFIDYNKTFYLINWKMFLEILGQMSVPYRLIKLIENLYLDSTAVIKTDNIPSDQCACVTLMIPPYLQQLRMGWSHS